MTSKIQFIFMMPLIDTLSQEPMTTSTATMKMNLKTHWPNIGRNLIFVFGLVVLSLKPKMLMLYDRG